MAVKCLIFGKLWWQWWLRWRWRWWRRLFGNIGEPEEWYDGSFWWKLWGRPAVSMSAGGGTQGDLGRIKTSLLFKYALAGPLLLLPWGKVDISNTCLISYLICFDKREAALPDCEVHLLQSHRSFRVGPLHGKKHLIMIIYGNSAAWSVFKLLTHKLGKQWKWYL